jgi:hypothetical protein
MMAMMAMKMKIGALSARRVWTYRAAASIRMTRAGEYADGEISMTLSWPILASLIMAGTMSTNELNIKVTAQRPMLEAVKQLRQRHGWQITYEDDAMSGIDSYSMEFVYSAPNETIGPLQILTKLVDTHARLGHGQFKLDRSKSAWHIVPLFGSILDTKISMPDQNMPLKNAVETICAAAQQESGRKIVAGRFTVNPSKSVCIHSEKESARMVLARTISEYGPGAPLNWDLLYNDDLEGYILVVKQFYKFSGADGIRTAK